MPSTGASIGLRVEIDGVAEVRKKLAKATKAYERAMAAAQYATALDIDALAVQMVPVDFGRLRSSHYVAPPTFKSSSLPETEIGFGTNYAVPVHEVTQVFHRVGRPKYLRRAVEFLPGGVLGNMAKRTQKFFELGVGLRAIPKTAPKEPDPISDAEVEKRRAARAKARKSKAGA